MPSRFKKGLSLGAVLALLAACSAFIFIIGALGIFNLRLEGAAADKEQARNLAESAVQMGIAKLLEDENFGVAQAATETLSVPTAGYPAGASGLLSFNEGVAHGGGVHYSTNNLHQTTPVTGDGRSVPGSTVHLVGKGICGEEDYEVECLFYRPPFPRGLASNGSITADGLTLLGLAEVSSFSGTVGSLPAEARKPAHIFSNSADTTAVNLGVGSNIYGDVGAVGGVTVAPSAVVRGEVRPHGVPQEPPGLDVDELISKVEGFVGSATLTGNVGPQTIDWFRAGNGPLTIHGDLHLDGGVLVVRGNLTVRGSVSGHGAILADGGITIDGAGDLEGLDNIAVAAKGDVVLAGGGKNSYFFNGLLYSERQIDVHDLTLLGTVVSNGPPDQLGLKLTNVNLLQTDVSVQVGIGIPFYYEDSDDSLMYWIDRVPTSSGEDRFSLTAYYSFGPGAGADPNSSDWSEDIHLTDLDEEQVRSALISFAGQDGSDTMTDQATTTVGPYLDGLLGRGSSEYVLDLTLNRVLTPVKKSKILLWKRLD
ncbi:MAG: hypothetical protein KC910_25365 [Candidatus Eremiobacteraeota bacterium]|nr:hypothetical protein [Candidatus Eremiobacteraeota bacterium]